MQNGGGGWGVTITAKELVENIANASAMFEKKYRDSDRGTFAPKLVKLPTSLRLQLLETIILVNATFQKPKFG